MKILALTCMHERNHISQIFLEGMKRLDIPVLAACTHSDSIDLLHEYGNHGILIKNSPLGAKWNSIARYASVDPKWTHLLITGDDNLYHNNLIDLWYRNRHHGYVGLRNIYFIDPIFNRSLSLKYAHNPPIAIGTGRLLSREAFIKSGIAIWNNTIDRELDFSNDMYLLQGGYYPVLVDGDETMCIDIKSDKSMWSFNNFINNGELIDYNESISWISEKEREMLCILGL